jgi:hypothetical protein
MKSSKNRTARCGFSVLLGQMCAEEIWEKDGHGISLLERLFPTVALALRFLFKLIPCFAFSKQRGIVSGSSSVSILLCPICPTFQ